MSTLLQLDQMTREEKFRALDELWKDLYPDEEAVEPPAWHREALEETHRRYIAGLEKPLEPDEAESLLRKRVGC